MLKIIYIFVIFAFWVTTGNATTLTKSCDNNEYKIAEAKLSAVAKGLKKSKVPWDDLAKVFKIWEPCKEKFQDEEFIDVIADLVSNRWDRISDLLQVKTENPTFYKYILVSLANDTVGRERWKKILNLVREKCPSIAKEVCKDIENADQTRR